MGSRAQLLASFIVSLAASLVAWRLQSDLVRTLAIIVVICSLGAMFWLIVFRYQSLLGIIWRYAATAIVLRGDEVLMIYHPFYSKWLPPGSRVHFQEYPEMAVKRAVLEETGYEVIFDPSVHYPEKSVDRDTWQLPQPYYVAREEEGHRSGVKIHYDFYYVCRTTGQKPQRRGTLDHKWFSVMDIRQLVDEGSLFPDVGRLIERALLDVNRSTVVIE
jgi:8-oxo-dGTP pyrophosphatase MutT (NUDIX family)